MKDKTEFGFWEMVFFLINAISVKTLLVHPLLISKNGGSAAILLSAYISIIGFAFTSLIVLLYNKFKNTDLLELIRKRLGKIVFIIAAVLFFGMYVINTGLALRNICENIKLTIFKDSSIILVFIYVFIAMCAGAWLGLKAIIRLHTIIIPILLALFSAIFLSVVDSYNPNNIFPIFGKGFPMLYYGFIFSSYFTDIISVLILSKYVKSDVSIPKVCFTAQGISSVILIVTVSIYVFILPYPASTEFFMPLYQLERYLEHETILSRLESIFSSLWFTSFFLYLSSMLIITCTIFSKIFKKSNYKQTIIPIAFLCSTIGICPKSSLIVLKMTENNLYLRMGIGFVLTILLLTIAHFRREKT